MTEQLCVSCHQRPATTEVTFPQGEPFLVCDVCAEIAPFRHHVVPDLVNHPPHYGAHPSGVECIRITEHMNFNVGNAVKYLWRADEKGSPIEDLQKARWYVDREIQRRQAAAL